MDAVSVTLVKGSIMDPATELNGNSFRVAENPQVSSPSIPVVHTIIRAISLRFRQREVIADMGSVGNSSCDG